MMFNIQFNPTLMPQSYTQDARNIALRSGTSRDSAVNQPQEASQPLALGTVRSKSSLREDKFQHANAGQVREGSAVSGFKARSSSDEHYGLLENMMVAIGAMVS